MCPISHDKGVPMYAMLFLLVISALFSGFTNFDPLVLLGIFFGGLVIMGIIWLVTGGNPGAGFYLLMSFECILALFFVFTIPALL